MKHVNPTPETPQLNYFDVEEQQLYIELPPDDGSPHLISKAEPNQPTKEAHLGPLHPGSCSFKL